MPRGIAVDGSGNLYIADNRNYRIRKVSTDGIITTVAGTGIRGYSGDGGAATSAQVIPSYLALDGSGNIYFLDGAEWGNFWSGARVRKVSTDGRITKVAGTGEVSTISGDGGPATSAALFVPQGIAVDGSGNLYIAEDGYSYRVRKVSTDGIITTVFGKPDLARPTGIAVDSSGNLYIADFAYFIPEDPVYSYGGGRIHRISADASSPRWPAVSLTRAIQVMADRLPKHNCGFREALPPMA